MPLVLCGVAKGGYPGREPPGHSPRPRLGARAAPHGCSHLCTHLGADLGGLQDAELQSWEENTDVSLLLETASLPPALPSGFAFSPTPSMGRAPGDAVTASGDGVGAGRGRGGSQPRSHGREQQNCLKWTVFEVFCQPMKQSDMQMPSIRLPAACWGAATGA